MRARGPQYCNFKTKRRRNGEMIILLNIGRLFMVAWVIFGLLLIFAPSMIHRPSDQAGGIIQVVIAYSLGYLLDRALGLARRRRARAELSSQITSDSGGI
jgi:hypothetical protein